MSSCTEMMVGGVVADEIAFRKLDWQKPRCTIRQSANHEQMNGKCSILDL